MHFTKFTIEFVHWNILFCIEGVLLFVGEFQLKTHVSSRRAIYVDTATRTVIDLLFF